MDPLGDRMKNYEGVWNQVLPERTPVIVRVDGKAFHTATHGLAKPFDLGVFVCMQEAARELMDNMQNAFVAYHQSDEISILMVPYVNPETQPWYGNKLNKINSVAASIATRAFNRSVEEMDYGTLRGRSWLFDARAFTLPRDEVIRYFMWRQMDARRNAVSALARCYYSHKELQGKPTKVQLEMLEQAGAMYENYPPAFRLGKLISKDPLTGLLTIHGQCPDFVKNRELIESIVNIDKRDEDESRRVLEQSKEKLLD
jgi:tRNA(His) guanylyltransferase